MSDAVENTTSDGNGKNITNEIEVDSKTVKIFDIEELVPSSTPITVAYFEAYRTNELEYVPYLSPYNVGIQSSSEDDSSSDDSEENSDNNSENENNGENNSSNNNSNNNSN